MISFFVMIAFSTPFYVVRKDKDMFDTNFHTIYDSLFEKLISPSAGGGILLQSYNINLKMVKNFFVQCKASTGIYGLARQESADSEPICSGGGAFIEVNNLIISHNSFQGCTGKYLGCSIYSNAKSKLEMSYTMCCSSLSIDNRCNDITIEDGASSGMSTIEGSHINVTNSYLNENPAGSINVGIFPGSFNLNYICISFAQGSILSGLVLSTYEIGKVATVSNVFIENAKVTKGLFYTYNADVKLSNFNAVNSEGEILYKNNGDQGKITITNSHISKMSYAGCITSGFNIENNEGVYFKDFTHFYYIANPITCNQHVAWLSILSTASTILDADFV